LFHASPCSISNPSFPQDNIAEFLSWACYNSHLPELSGAQRAHIADFFTYIEAKHGVVLPKGINSDVKCVQLSLEPVTYIHRPLLMYVGVFCLELVMQFTLYFVGFSQKTTSAGLCYWFRPATDTASNPLLFFHGIAPGGPLFYLPMLFLGLLRNSTRGKRRGKGADRATLRRLYTSERRRE